MASTKSSRFAAVNQRIASWRKPLLISHQKPDGDALGSLVAVRAMLRADNGDPRAILFDPIPSRYSLFAGHDPLPVFEPARADALLADRDSVVILDTCAYSQLEPIAAWLRSSRLPKLAVDHHLTRDDLADEYLVDESAAATCLILLEWMRDAGRFDRLPLDACQALFVGLAMDTGWFRHSNTDVRTLRAAAELSARGVRPHELHQSLFLRETPARVRLLGESLRSVELLHDGRLSVMILSPASFQAAGASPADTEDVVNEPLRIESVVVSLLLVEQGDGLVRVNLRSKPPLSPADSDIDVAAVAAALGGGGHARAAGVRLRGPLSAIRETVVARLNAVLA